MKKLVTVTFKDETKSVLALFIDGYSTCDGVLQLYNYGPGAQTQIKIFPLTDVKEIDISEGPEVNII